MKRYLDCARLSQMLCEENRYVHVEKIQKVWELYSYDLEVEWARIPDKSGMVLGIMDNYLT